MKSIFARTPKTTFFTSGGTPRPRIPLRCVRVKIEILNSVSLYNRTWVLPVVNVERHYRQTGGKRDEADGHTIVQTFKIGTSLYLMSSTDK